MICCPTIDVASVSHEIQEGIPARIATNKKYRLAENLGRACAKFLSHMQHCMNLDEDTYANKLCIVSWVHLQPPLIRSERTRCWRVSVDPRFDGELFITTAGTPLWRRGGRKDVTGVELDVFIDSTICVDDIQLIISALNDPTHNVTA